MNEEYLNSFEHVDIYFGVEKNLISLRKFNIFKVNQPCDSDLTDPELKGPTYIPDLSLTKNIWHSIKCTVRQ